MGIRAAGPENYEDYCRLLHPFDQHFALQDPAFFRVPENPVRTKEFYQSLFGPERGVFMAFVDGRAVGLLNYWVEGPADYPSLVPRRVLFIPILTVEQDHRRRGIGTALMAEARRMAESMGCVATEFCVQEYNKEALEFYAALGYRTRERILTMAVI
jgi:GNAT superfamily N-acetyltransferase